MTAEILAYPVFQHLKYYGDSNILKTKDLAGRTISNPPGPPRASPLQFTLHHSLEASPLLPDQLISECK